MNGGRIYPHVILTGVSWQGTAKINNDLAVWQCILPGLCSLGFTGLEWSHSS